MAQFNHFGTISHGTLRPQDLLTAFSSTLEELHSGEYAHLITEAEDIAEFIDSDDDDGSKDEEASWCIDSLSDALNSFAPDGYYFGTHPGDGSDFGFWQDEDEDQGEGRVLVF